MKLSVPISHAFTSPLGDRRFALACFFSHIEARMEARLEPRL